MWDLTKKIYDNVLMGAWPQTEVTANREFVNMEGCVPVWMVQWSGTALSLSVVMGLLLEPCVIHLNGMCEQLMWDLKFSQWCWKRCTSSSIRWCFIGCGELHIQKHSVTSQRTCIYSNLSSSPSTSSFLSLVELGS